MEELMKPFMKEPCYGNLLAILFRSIWKKIHLLRLVVSMASSATKPGKLVALQELEPSSPFFKHGESLRVTGKLQTHDVLTGIAMIVERGVTLKIDTQHLRDTGFRVGSTYQFIGELLMQSDNDPILQARVGRNVDGIDLNLYYQSMKLRRQFEADIMKSSSA